MSDIISLFQYLEQVDATWILLFFASAVSLYLFRHFYKAQTGKEMKARDDLLTMERCISCAAAHCAMGKLTPEGTLAVYDALVWIPLDEQAAYIEAIEANRRDVLYDALMKLRTRCAYQRSYPVTTKPSFNNSVRKLEEGLRFSALLYAVGSVCLLWLFWFIMIKFSDRGYPVWAEFVYIFALITHITHLGYIVHMAAGTGSSAKRNIGLIALLIIGSAVLLVAHVRMHLVLYIALVAALWWGTRFVVKRLLSDQS